MENNYDSLKKILLEDRPAQWDALPDIELYMDQILGYMKRQHVGLDSGEALTSAMVNNYIKIGLLPRANGKKYNSDHIAYLTAICLIKQVLPINDVGVLLANRIGTGGVESFYGEYAGELDSCMKQIAEELPPTDSNAADAILKLAIKSYVCKFTCQKMLSQLVEKEALEKKQKQPPEKDKAKADKT